MFRQLVRRAKRALAAREAKEQENGYWRELTTAEIRDGVHRDFVGGMWSEIGELQLHFMIAQGLRPEHTLLDVGCGALRAGVHFIRYLEPGHYFGIDKNHSLIRAGRHEAMVSGLSERGANLRVNSAFDASAFGIQFDFVVAVSLFTHLYANHIARCLYEVSRVLSDDGRFYATFFEAPGPVHISSIVHSPGEVQTHLDADPFHYSFEELSAYARFVGLSARRIGEWGHPRNQKMLCFTRV